MIASLNWALYVANSKLRYANYELWLAHQISLEMMSDQLEGCENRLQMAPYEIKMSSLRASEGVLDTKNQA